MKLTRRFVNWGVAASLATPALLRSARADDSTIKIGMVLPVTGPAADNGDTR
jgi:branched-chain amino acid transport system substrate-binding protein